METKEYVRYAIDNGIYVIETTTFVKNHPAQATVDVRLVSFSGETGKWFWLSSVNLLADKTIIDDLNAGQPIDPLVAPLRSGVTLITQTDYDTEMASQDAAVTTAEGDIIAAKAQRKADRDAVLTTLGVAAEDLELFD